MTNWISVKDRLPEFGERVLTYNPTTKYDSQRIMVSTLKSNYINDPDTGRPLFLVKVLNPVGLEGYLHDVSHWMPLPEPPCDTHKRSKRMKIENLLPQFKSGNSTPVTQAVVSRKEIEMIITKVKEETSIVAKVEFGEDVFKSMEEAKFLLKAFQFLQKVYYEEAISGARSDLYHELEELVSEANEL